MTLVASTPDVRLRLGVPFRWLVSVLVLTGCGVFMFFDLKPTPVVLWDESRMAVNALEMNLSGHLSLVTTYGFRPDLWNTKPPLLIWLMDLSMTLFGVSEWSMRLPSMVSALATLALVMSFTRRVTRSVWAGALAAVLLALSVLFFAEHGARTGDYEALLCLLTFGYLYILFFALHRRRPHAGAVLAAGGLVAAAILTKSIAGLLPGLGVPVYLAIVRRPLRPVQSPWYLLAGTSALAVAGAYFLLRDHAAPGYLRAVMFNDVSGRYGGALDNHGGPPWYYLRNFFLDGAFSAGLLGALAPLALLVARGPARLAMLFSLCVTAGVLVVLSFSATKLIHYGATTCPFIAVCTAIAAHEGLKALKRAGARGQVSLVWPKIAYSLIALVLLATGARSVYARLSWLEAREDYPQARYGELFDELSARGDRSVQVVDGGVVKVGVAVPGPEGGGTQVVIRADGVPRDYSPQLDFYRLRAHTRGLEVARIAPERLGKANHGELLATCDPDYAPRLRSIGVNLAATPGCAAIRR